MEIYKICIFYSDRVVVDIIQSDDIDLEIAKIWVSATEKIINIAGKELENIDDCQIDKSYCENCLKKCKKWLESEAEE